MTTLLRYALIITTDYLQVIHQIYTYTEYTENLSVLDIRLV